MPITITVDYAPFAVVGYVIIKSIIWQLGMVEPDDLVTAVNGACGCGTSLHHCVNISTYMRVDAWLVIGVVPAVSA